MEDLKTPNVPTVGLSNIFGKMMAQAMNVDEDEARIILNLN